MICDRYGCGVEFEGHRRGTEQRYCSSLCANRAYSAFTKPAPFPGAARTTAGAIGELAASVDLLAQGFEVFRALSPDCSCDLIACRGGHTLRIEVRVGRRNAATGHVSYARRDTDRADHYCVVLGAADLFYDPPLP